MKTLLIIIVIGLAGFGIWKAIETKPDATTPVATITEPSLTETPVVPADVSEKQTDNTKVTVGFTGFGPGKKHVGSFSDVRSNLVNDNEKGLTGTIVVGMNSLTSDTEKVTTHLKTADFFDTTKYPTATFTITEDLTASTCGGDNVRCKAPYLYGNFTIHGVTKGISFPVVKNADKYTATFTLNLKEFGIDQKFANETVELNIVVPLK